MTTPADFPTPKRIVSQAAYDAGYLREGQELSSEKFADYITRLNDMLNLWATQGLKLWTQTDLSIALTAGVREYLLGPTGTFIATRPYRALQGYYLDSSDNRRPIYPLSWDEWLRLSTITQQGAISQYFVDKQQVDLHVHFWLTPDTTAATGTAHLLLQQQIANFIELDETINLPIEWYMAVRWGFAAEICSGQPQAIIERCEGRAMAFRKMVEDWDVEDADTRFSPDNQARGSYANRGFL